MPDMHLLQEQALVPFGYTRDQGLLHHMVRGYARSCSSNSILRRALDRNQTALRTLRFYSENAVYGWERICA